MSPEQLRELTIDPRTDIFSFGAVLYEMLSGRRAFGGTSAADTISAILNGDPPELSGTNKNINTGVDRVVRRCLEKNREERFHSASDLAFALEPTTSLVDERNNFIPSVDGQRFLIKTLVEDANTHPITLVLNWAAGLER